MHNVSVIGLLQAAAVTTIIFSFVTALDTGLRDIELFSHFRLQYLVVSILLLIVFSINRQFAYAGALALTVIFNAAFILPWYFGDKTVPDGKPLKLVHANVQSGNTDYARLLEFVGTENPDMFFMQEVTPQWASGTSSLLEDYPYAYTESRQGNFGIAAYSKIPFDSIRHVDSPPLGYPTIIATVTIGTEEITIISSHPTIPVGRQLYDARNEQLKGVAALVKQTSGKIILLGDFNASLWCTGLRELEKTTGLKNVRRGFGIIPTWPTFFPFAMIPIDHALVSSSISVLDVRAGSRVGSDHLPLIVTLSL